MKSVTAAPTAIAIDPSMLQHVSIRASAGSGKTFQLTNRYLQLVGAGAEPSSILASTFTRLAAGQIRDRILMRIAEAIEDEKKRFELAGHLGVTALSRDSLLTLLGSLARHLNQMQIRTLDSFFASIVHAFAIELDIPIGAEMVDENQARRMRAEAIRLMLDERNPQELIELLRLLTQGASERGVMNTIDHTVNHLYSLYCEGCDSAWECVPELPGTLKPPMVIDAIQQLEESKPTNNARHLKAHTSDCQRAREWKWDDFIGNGLTKAIVNGSCEYHKKPIERHVIEAYQPLVGHARAELVGRVRDQTIATRELLKHYRQHYEAVKHREHAVTFDDLTVAMVRAEQLGQLDEIGFRVDAKLRHLLLDEFQDTSVPQWRALQPIAQELVSYLPPQRSFFCVGDVKQSIYGWRDAAPEVLDELPNLLIGPDGRSAITQSNLARSYRSSPVVIDVVNRVFESLANNRALEECADAVAAWQTGFTLHETAKTELPGYVELRTAKRAAEGQDKNVIRYAAAADLAADLHQRHPDLSIAILTRTNRAVARLLFELGPSKRNIAVSARGGGPLIDAPAVNAILDLLQMADHPDNTIAAFHVANSPLGAVIGLQEWNNIPQRHCVASAVRRQLMNEGYSKTIADWVRSIAADCDAREYRRLLQLVQLASAHDVQRTLRTDDFIELVTNTDVADVQGGGPPVQVMTIHQAKGLEFGVVILPELEAALTGSGTPPVVFDRENETGPIMRICRYMKRETLELVPELLPLFERHKRRTVRESLSLLYVAMTRAIHGLYMIIDPPNENERSIPKKLSGVLRCALAAAPIEAESVLYSHGDPEWQSTQDVTNRSGEEVIRQSDAGPVRSGASLSRRSITLAESPNGVLTRGVSAAAASARAEHGAQHRLLRLPDAEARDRGIVMHALFEQIEWLEEFQPDEETLLRVVRGKAPRRDKKWMCSQVQAFLASLRLPAVQQTFCRGNADAAFLRLYREYPFARIADDSNGGAGGTAGVQSGFIDRLVVQLDEKCAIRSATVIDFKTDAVDAQAAAAHAENYRPQMDVYRSATSEILEIAAKAVAVRLLFVGAGAVVDLG